MGVVKLELFVVARSTGALSKEELAKVMLGTNEEAIELGEAAAARAKAMGDEESAKIIKAIVEKLKKGHHHHHH
uniref:LRO-C3-7 n=1 Tax=Escherichia coli TaxID=562 RepID=UPI003FA61591